jgi:hypothetical protein
VPVGSTTRGVELRDLDPVTGERIPHDDRSGGTLDHQRACAESRQVAGRFSLEDSVPVARLGRVSLRWICVHLIEETARHAGHAGHAGHADILREQTDGATGFDG